MIRKEEEIWRKNLAAQVESPTSAPSDLINAPVPYTLHFPPTKDLFPEETDRGTENWGKRITYTALYFYSLFTSGRHIFFSSAWILYLVKQNVGESVATWRKVD
jgi:hypothetical protein